MTKKHWYKQTVSYCPVCMKEKRERERVYGKKPKKAEKRYLFLDRWDYCDAF